MPGDIIEKLIIEIAGDSRKFTGSIKEMKKEGRSLETSLKSVAKVGGIAFTALGSAATALGVKATNAFKDFETGVTNVAKTTNLSGKELEDFKDEIISMSEEIPVTTDRLLEIATAAGQLGITGTKDLSKFTAVVAKLGATTDVEGEAAALSLARILNLTNESIDSSENFASALVALGNSFETSESQILEMATELAKSTVQFGLSSDKILGLAATMTSLGINVEAGSTVIGQAFIEINNAIRNQAGPAFEKLIELTGMSGEMLTQVFQQDANAAFTAFIQGLSKAKNENKNLTKELEALGLRGIRIEKILPTLATQSEKLGKALKMAGEESKRSSALNDEASKAFETSASKLEIAQNKINNLFIQVGEVIAPSVIEAVEGITETVRNSEPVIRNLAESFAFAFESAVKLASGLQELARRVRIFASLDEASIKSRDETILQEQHLKKLLEERGITEEEFRKQQRQLAADRKKASAEAVEALKEETAAQAERTAGFLQSTSDFKASETDKTNTLVTESTKRRQQEASNQKAVTDIKKAAADEQLKIEQEKNQKLLKEQLKADQEIFDESTELADGLEEQRRDGSLAIQQIESEKWENLSEAQKQAYTDQLNAAIEHSMAVGEIERAAELERYKRKLKGDQDIQAQNEKWMSNYQQSLKRHSAVISAINATQQDSRYKITKEGIEEVAKLTESENDDLKEIGKAAALVQMGISTIESAQKAYNSLAWIPYVGVPLGVASAAVVAAYGIEQTNKIRAMKTGGVFGTGGMSSIVPGVGTGDKVNAFLEPGELVVPRDITKQIMSEYGSVRGMREGGSVGEDERTGLHKTFASIFKVPAIFKALIAGKDAKTSASVKGGFGADAFDGMVPAMMDALRESAYEMQDEALSVVPGGPILAALQKLINKPIDEIHDIMQNNAVTKFIGDNLGSDAAKVLTGGGPLTDAVDSAVNNLIDSVNDAVSSFFGFKNGGVPGMVSPGEMRMSKKALSAIASGVNMSKTAGPVARPSMSRVSSGGTTKSIVGVEIGIAPDAIDIITARQREKSILNT